MNHSLLSEGPEPVINPKDPCELSWGLWSLKARVEVRLHSDDVTLYPLEPFYTITISYQGDGDSGVDGLFGELSTSGAHCNLDEAATNACRLRPTLMTPNWEENEPSFYVRGIDVSLIIAAACIQVKEIGFKNV